MKTTLFSKGLLLTQQKYINDLLAKMNMYSANPVLTPMAAHSPFFLTTRTNLDDGSEYRKLIGSLQYLQLTLPDVVFAVNRLSQFMHKPTDAHLQAVNRVLRYLVGTRDQGIFLSRNNSRRLHVYSDVDWSGNKDDYSSISAHIVYLGLNPIVWSSKKRKTEARSFIEVEYKSVAEASLDFVGFSF